MYKYIALIFGCFTMPAMAETANILSVDYAIKQKLNHTFSNDSNIHPERSDFTVLSTVSMSSESGERWAVVTLQNNASGGRSLNQKQLLGLFANGKRMQPTAFLQRFKGHETVSITVSFGEHQFPLLEVYTNPID